MPKIEIRELDLTTPGVYAERDEVVYIPGFVDVTQEQLYRTNKVSDKNYEITSEYIGLEKGVPTLFTSAAQFEAACGTRPAKFEGAQRYSYLNYEEDGEYKSGFDENAIPYTNTMFNEGACDPSYILAKELLAAGLNVLYERVNGDPVEQAVPRGLISDEEWGETYRNYFVKVDAENYIPVTGKVAPDWEESAGNGVKYYNKVVKYNSAEESYILLTEQPNNWVTDFHLYLTKDEFGMYTPVKALKEVRQEAPLFVESLFYSKSTTTNKDGKEEVGYVLLESEPEDWATNCTAYFVSPDVPVEFITTLAPEFELNKYYVSDGATVDASGTYSYELIGSKPEDWVTNYTDYFTKEAVLVRAQSDEKASIVYKKVCGYNIKTMYEALESYIYDNVDVDRLIDKGNYSIKYLTSGGYPTFEYKDNAIVTKMLALAETRGDCVALIDPTDCSDREANIHSPGSLYKAVSDAGLTTFNSNGEFGTMFTPWAEYARTTSDKDATFYYETGVFDTKTSKGYDTDCRFSATFAYLTSLADSIKTNAPWLAVAGAARGGVLNLTANGMTTIISNGAADGMQPRQGMSINAITNIKPYGNIIWGNRTLKNNAENLVATSFLNIRNLVSDVKKVIYRTARKLTFEQNNDVLWVNFKSGIVPTLDRMLSGAGISDYKIVRDYEHEKAQEKATVCAKVFLYPLYPVEDFYITVVLKDDEVIVE